MSRTTKRIDGVMSAAVGNDWITLNFGSHTITIDKLKIYNGPKEDIGVALTKEQAENKLLNAYVKNLLGIAEEAENEMRSISMKNKRDLQMDKLFLEKEVEEGNELEVERIAIHAIDRAIKAEAALTKEREANKKMREGLEWYADARTWKLGVTITMGSAHPHHEPIKEDQGKRARSILEGNEPNEGNTP